MWQNCTKNLIIHTSILQQQNCIKIAFKLHQKRIKKFWNNWMNWRNDKLINKINVWLIINILQLLLEKI